MVYCQIRYTSDVNVRTFQYIACTDIISAVWIEKNNGAFIFAFLRLRLWNYCFLTTDCICDGYSVITQTNWRGVYSGVIAQVW